MSALNIGLVSAANSKRIATNSEKLKDYLQNMMEEPESEMPSRDPTPDLRLGN